MHRDAIFDSITESVNHLADYGEHPELSKLLLLQASLLAAHDAVKAQIQVHLAEVDKPSRKRQATSINQFYAVADELGLDTKNDDGMRRALSELFGREIKSRKSLTMDDWAFATNALDGHRLSWGRREAAAA